MKARFDMEEQQLVVPFCIVPPPALRTSTETGSMALAVHVAHGGESTVSIASSSAATSRSASRGGRLHHSDQSGVLLEALADVVLADELRRMQLRNREPLMKELGRAEQRERSRRQSRQRRERSLGGSQSPSQNSRLHEVDSQPPPDESANFVKVNVIDNSSLRPTRIPTPLSCLQVSKAKGGSRHMYFVVPRILKFEQRVRRSEQQEQPPLDDDGPVETESIPVTFQPASIPLSPKNEPPTSPARKEEAPADDQLTLSPTTPRLFATGDSNSGGAESKKVTQARRHHFRHYRWRNFSSDSSSEEDARAKVTANGKEESIAMGIQRSGSLLQRGYEAAAAEESVVTMAASHDNHSSVSAGGQGRASDPPLSDNISMSDLPDSRQQRTAFDLGRPLPPGSLPSPPRGLPSGLPSGLADKSLNPSRSLRTLGLPAVEEVDELPKGLAQSQEGLRDGGGIQAGASTRVLRVEIEVAARLQAALEGEAYLDLTGANLGEFEAFFVSAPASPASKQCRFKHSETRSVTSDVGSTACQAQPVRMPWRPCWWRRAQGWGELRLTRAVFPPRVWRWWPQPWAAAVRCVLLTLNQRFDMIYPRCCSF